MISRSCFPALLLLAVIACSTPSGRGMSVRRDSTGSDTAFVAIPANTTPAPSARANPPLDASDACHIMPLDSAAQILQRTVGATVHVAAPRGSGNCTYLDAATGAQSLKASIDVGHSQTAASAGTTLFMLRSQEESAGNATSDIPGIGDAAFGASDTTGSYGVKAQRGAWVIQVGVTAPHADASALRAGASALAKYVVGVLP